MKIYISFGSNHTHYIGDMVFNQDVAAVIKCQSVADGRAAAFALFGSKFSTHYNEAEVDAVLFPGGHIEVPPELIATAMQAKKSEPDEVKTCKRCKGAVTGGAFCSTDCYDDHYKQVEFSKRLLEVAGINHSGDPDEILREASAIFTRAAGVLSGW